MHDTPAPVGSSGEDTPVPNAPPNLSIEDSNRRIAALIDATGKILNVLDALQARVKALEGGHVLLGETRVESRQ